MRTVIISGASSGIGQATAERFAGAGDRVVNLDVRPPAEAREDVRWIKVDVADWTAVRDAVAEVHADYGSLDVVIANAGISVRHGVLELTEADARRMIDVNLMGVLALWRHAAEYMVTQPASDALSGRVPGAESGAGMGVEAGGVAGVLLATASVNGMRGYPFYADYNATKAGIAALCRTFALELSPRIRAACVSPGAVLTPMQLAEYTGEMLEETNRAIPSRRHAAPSEIADAFYFLASPQAAFFTGQELVIDGGETAGATTAVFGTGGLAV
jgi:3-oxoacyl-[acyl-carrier protein] reductase